MQHTLPLLAVMAGALCAAPAQATTTSSASLSWQACNDVPDGIPAGIASRVQCATLSVPLDWHHAAAHPYIDVQVMRVRAGRPEARRGAIFVNQGGPGVDNRQAFLGMANSWQAKIASDALEGSKRRMADHFDLVMVVPRWIGGALVNACSRIDEDAARRYFLEDQSDANWQALDDSVKRFAETCSAHPEAATTTTEQHVRDMEKARILMGEPTLNFFGASYGTAVGAMYGSLFPHHMGRMVMDSAMNASKPGHWQFIEAQGHRYRDLWRFATSPAAKDPARWGLGSDSRAIYDSLKAMPMILRATWAQSLTLPEDVAAAVKLASWYGAEPAARRTRTVMLQHVSDYRFDTNIHRDEPLRRSAEKLAGKLPDVAGDLSTVYYGADAATFAVHCNDSRWFASPDAIRSQFERVIKPYVAVSDGRDNLLSLVCAHWTPNEGASRPSMEKLRLAPEFLVIQNRRDWFTPLGGVEDFLAAVPNARMVVVEDNRHVVMAGPANCATAAAGTFLTTGTLPAALRSTCQEGQLTPHVPGREEL